MLWFIMLLLIQYSSQQLYFVSSVYCVNNWAWNRALLFLSGALRSCGNSLLFLLMLVNYEGRSINKLQNGAIPLILKRGKIRHIRFVGNLILNIHRNFFDDDVIIATSSVYRTQSICVLFSPPVFCHNSQFITVCIQQRNERKTNKFNKLMLPL